MVKPIRGMTKAGQTIWGVWPKLSKLLGGYDQRWPNYSGRVTKAGGTDRGGTWPTPVQLFGRGDQS